MVLSGVCGSFVLSLARQFFKMARGDTFKFMPLAVPPLIMVITICYYAFFPWQERKGMWRTVFEVFGSPYTQTTFRHTFTANWMTSFVRVFQDLAYSACYYMGGGERAWPRAGGVARTRARARAALRRAILAYGGVGVLHFGDEPVYGVDVANYSHRAYCTRHRENFALACDGACLPPWPVCALCSGSGALKIFACTTTRGSGFRRCGMLQSSG